MGISKRIAIIEDLCGIGRCALSVALPVIASYGHQPCPVPTAVFSAHTAFEHVVKMDLTGYLGETLKAYEGREFDALMTGYLLSEEQAHLVAEYVGANRKNIALVLVDPAMADNGELYRGLPESMIGAYRALIGRADIITPNLTEAALLTGRPPDDPLARGGLSGLMEDLLTLGPSTAVVKGMTEGGRMFNAYRSSDEGEVRTCQYEKRPGNYPGAGDLFKSVLLCELLGGSDIGSAVARASDFVARAIDEAISQNMPPREGLPFERLLSSIHKRNIFFR